MKRMYVVHMCVLACLVLAGCAGTPESRDTASMIEGIHAADKAFNGNDLESYASHFTDDFIHDEANFEPSDRSAFFEMVGGFFESFPGVRNYQRDLLPDGNFVIFDECTFDIPVPGTDQVITVFHLDIVEMEGSKLKVKSTFGDGATFGVAFGQIYPPVPKPMPATFDLPTPRPTDLPPVEAQAEFQARWNNHDVRGIAEMIHNDAEILVSPLLEPTDRNSYIGWQELMFALVPDLRMRTTRVYDGDRWAATEVMLTGTNTGALPGFAPTNRPIQIEAAYLARYDERGHMTSLKLFVDSMVILEQLGLAATPIEM